MEFKGTREKWLFFKGDENKTTSIKIGDAHDIELEINGKDRIEEEIANGLLISKAPEMLELLQRIEKILTYETIEPNSPIQLEIFELISEATKI